MLLLFCLIKKFYLFFFQELHGVGHGRSDNHGTDGPDGDGFILVEGRKKRKQNRVTWEAVTRKVPAATRDQEALRRIKSVLGSLSRNNPVSNDEV